ncbi:MAG: NYN domain-containing protein [Chloroflexota bacterium]|nr:NYN domain-containing protein [Chloroflexota bacterium]
MPYLIDGHNLIGQLPDISLADPNDEAKLVLKLIGFAARMQTKCVVVFDQGMTAGKSRLSNGVVEVVFAAPRANADAIMMGRIRATRDPRYWIVVSNDQEVLNCARARKMKTIRSVDFARELRPLSVHDKTARSPAAPHARAYRIKDMRPDDDPGAAEDVRLSAAEIEMWLKLFNERK